MKKAFITFSILLCSIFLTGCNKYISANTNGQEYYGAYNRRDMIHADVKLFKKNTDVYCDGIVFINAPSRSITIKNDDVNAKLHLACSDNTLIDAKLLFRKGSFDECKGTGFDQLDNKYEFKEITKDEFIENLGSRKIEFINGKNTSLIKY